MGAGVDVSAPNAEDDNWDPRFDTFGTDDTIYAMATDGHNLYIGGDFEDVAGTRMRALARWDGSHWSSLGEVEGGGVYALAISGTHLYAGGSFHAIGGVAADGIAMWDGSQWHPLGAGIIGRVMAISITGNDVYVGGEFTQAGDVDAKNIAMWDGSQWHALGNGIYNTQQLSWVIALAVVGSDLYVGGTYNMAGDTPANNIARWDGSQWHALGSGVNSPVTALATKGLDLYVGGGFLLAGDVAVHRIARWDGSQWHALGSGVDGNNRYVVSLAWDGDCLYAGGTFATAGTVIANNIARWDGSQWYSLGSGAANGTRGQVRAMAVIGGNLYAGGRIFEAGDQAVGNLARWNGSLWFPVTASSTQGIYSSYDTQVYSLEVFGNNVFAGGYFFRAGTADVQALAMWNGRQWLDPVGTRSHHFTPSVYAMDAHGDDLYVGGSFADMGGVLSRNIVRRNGNQWYALGPGIDGGPYPRVFAIAAGEHDVYAGGTFTGTAGLPTNNIARWDGSQWHALGDGPSNGVYGNVYSLAISGTEVYVGGDFLWAGNVLVSGIAKWDGTGWSALGSGVNGYVKAILIQGDDIYVGGRFSIAGGQTAYNIARWDGSQWHPVGEGMQGDNFDVRALALIGDKLYAGGNFYHNVARWDGTEWHYLGSGTYGPVNTLAVLDNDLYVAGYFTEAGAKPSYNVAIWHEPLGAPPTPTPLPCSAGQFADATACSTFYSYITCLVEKNVISGYPCGTRPGEPCDETNRPYFRPGDPVTRGQLSKIVALAATLQDAIPPDRQTYADVTPGSPFWQYIERLSERGVMSGYPCGGPDELCDEQARPYFRPGANVSRGQTAKIVSNVAGYDEPIAKCQQTFADTPPAGEGSTFWEYIERLSGRSVMSGYTCGGVGEPCDSNRHPYFRPGNSVTRGQSSKIVANTFYPDCQAVDAPTRAAHTSKQATRFVSRAVGSSDCLTLPAK
jgi:hypothetical protein